MAASSGGLAATPLPLSVKIRRVGSCTLPLIGSEVWRRNTRGGGIRYRCCCSNSELRKQAGPDMAAEEIKRRVATRAMPAVPFPSRREKEWGINLLNESIKESGTNEDGTTWYREGGEDLGVNGCKCRWARMGGQCSDDSSKWKETWWEKSDWTGYKELGAEKSGKNATGDSWWETWQEVMHQDEWSNLARIERSAQKQAKSGTENAGWYEKWWEKYDAKGSTEKGAHKYGRVNEQSWWEKWGEQYDGRGFVLKWTDKWAETKLGTRWGDKWEEKFFAGIGSRQGETWHISPSHERWSRTWGEEHFGNGKVHKYGKSTTGESWDIVVDEETCYEAEPHYGWADVVGDSSQLLSIQPRDRPPDVYPSFDFGSSPPPSYSPPDAPPSSS